MAQKKTKTAPAAKTKTAKRGAASKKSGAAARGGAAKPASRAKKGAGGKPAAKPSAKKAAKAAPAKKVAKTAPAKKKPAAPKRAPKAAKAAKPPAAAKRAAKPAPKPADKKVEKRTPKVAEKRAPKATRSAAPKSTPVAVPAPVKTASRGSKPKGARSRSVEATTESFKPVFTAKQLQPIRERLLARKEEIVRMYRADLRSGQESNDSPTEDLVDRANNAYSRELSYSISDAERALVLQIDEALARVEEGTYGRCAHCGRPIAQPRLEALPWARLCIDCAELLEKGLLTEP